MRTAIRESGRRTLCRTEKHQGHAKKCPGQSLRWLELLGGGNGPPAIVGFVCGIHTFKAFMTGAAIVRMSRPSNPQMIRFFHGKCFT